MEWVYVIICFCIYKTFFYSIYFSHDVSGSLIDKKDTQNFWTELNVFSNTKVDSSQTRFP